MKKVLYIIIFLLILVATVLTVNFLNEKAIDTSYHYAITLIQNGSYEEALLNLEKANPNLLDRKTFKSEAHKLKDTYKNTIPLYAYALAQAEYNDENKSMYTVNNYLTIIPTDYSGELCEEIKTFQGNFKPQYDEFLKEEKRKAEELRIQTEKSQQEFFASLKTRIPYEGMSEKYINKTIMGNYHEIKFNSEYGFTHYYWKTNYGDIMLIVTCYENSVSSVSRYGWGYFWTEDIKPIWNGKNPYKNKQNSSTTKKSDPYNVYDYSDPEDFYYDNYDDFWDYEEAEDYFNEHHD